MTDSKIEAVASEVEGKIDPEMTAVDVATTKGHALDVGPASITVDLPCGCIDGDNGLHRTITFCEMKGREEDLLGGSGDMVERLSQVIVNCTLRIGSVDDRRIISDMVAQMSSSDRLISLIAIRRLSLGDHYDMSITCPANQCGAKSRFSVDLSGLEIKPMPDPMVRTMTNEMCTGSVYKWHLMVAKDESWLQGMKRSLRNESPITMAMLSRLDKVDNFVFDRDTPRGTIQAIEFLQDRPSRERNEFREIFPETEGGVDTDIEFKCPACQRQWESELNVGNPSFFFPSVK